MAHRTFSATATMPKIRVSIINVPTELSPLKLRGFLRGQAQDIQALTKHREDITVIRVFVPSRIGAALGVKKLDGIFQKIVDSLANIARAELVETSQSLTPSEMIEESEMQKEVLEKVIEPSHSDSNPPFH